MKTIRELLEQQGWTQLQLAIKLGVTPVTVYNWERGKTEPKVGQFRSLARVFGVSMDDIALPEPGPETYSDAQNPRLESVAPRSDQ